MGGSTTGDTLSVADLALLSDIRMVVVFGMLLFAVISSGVVSKYHVTMFLFLN